MKRISIFATLTCLGFANCALESQETAEKEEGAEPAMAAAAVVATSPTDCTPDPTIPDLDLVSTVTPTIVNHLDIGASGASRSAPVITQLTNVNKGAMLTYYDVPAYSESAASSANLASKRLIFNAQDAEKKQGVRQEYSYAVSTMTDGTDPMIVAKWKHPSTPTSYAFTSTDGKLLVYLARMKQKKEVGLCGVWLDATRSRTPFRITKKNHICTDDGAGECDQRPTLSPPVYAENLRKYVIVYTFDTAVFALDESGEPVYASAGDGRVNLQRPSEIVTKKRLGFHRVRVNPALPNLVMVRFAERGQYDATGGLFVINLENSTAIPKLALDRSDGFHPIWRPDGMAIGINRRSDKEQYFAELTMRQSSPGTPQYDEQKNVSFELPAAGANPFSKTQVKGVFYATYSSDSRYVALATRVADENMPSDTATRIFVVDRADPSRVLPVARTDFWMNNQHEDGQPRLSFYDGTRGLVFSTDRGSANPPPDNPKPQVYTVMGAILPK